MGELVAAGLTDRIVLSSSAIGVAKGQSAPDVGFVHVLTEFAPRLLEAGVADGDVRRILADNPQTFLTVR